MTLNVVSYGKCILDGVAFVKVFIFILILYTNTITDGYKMYLFKNKNYWYTPRSRVFCWIDSYCFND